MRPLAPFVFLCALAAQLPAQQPDAHARSISLRGYDLIQLADTLTAPFPDDRDRLRAIFVWVTANIAYDCSGSNARDSLAWQVDEADRLYSTRSRLRLILKNRRALCGGYAFLVKTLCDLAEVEARTVEGKAYGGGGVAEGHAWNAVRLGGQWYWLDATWASGTCEGRRFVRRHDETWYLDTPERMRRSHLAHEGMWE
jgi:transglutaminase/protease-like cytokinesis protein 3